MRVPAFSLIFLSLNSCNATDETRSARLPSSPCAERSFDDSRFIVCRSVGAIEIVSGARTFNDLSTKLGQRANNVGFAMNAGMFDTEGKPIGLMVEDGREVHKINRRKGGGNFHMMPNGVFLIRRDGSASVVESDAFKPATDIAFATQSGPMLLMGGKLHPSFDTDGESRYIRNAVGIDRGGTPVFVISREPVSFGKIARFYRDALGASNALYLDGSVSSLWDPANGRMDAFTELGPMIVCFRKAAVSAPGREVRAKP